MIQYIQDEKNEKLIEKALKEGRELADKIQSAKTILEIDALSDEIEKYGDFADKSFGIIDEFTKNEDDKYSDLTFYLYMAIEEKKLHLDYYNLHPNEICSGILDFINYLESKTWVKK